MSEALDKAQVLAVLQQAKEAMETGGITLSIHYLITACQAIAREEATTILSAPSQGAPAPGEDAWLHESISAVADLPFSCSDCTVDDIVRAATGPALRTAHARLAEVTRERDEAWDHRGIASREASALRTAVLSARDKLAELIAPGKVLWLNSPDEARRITTTINAVREVLTAALEGSAGTQTTEFFAENAKNSVPPDVARKLVEALNAIDLSSDYTYVQVNLWPLGFWSAQISVPGGALFREWKQRRDEALSLAEHGGG